MSSALVDDRHRKVAPYSPDPNGFIISSKRNQPIPNIELDRDCISPALMCNRGTQGMKNTTIGSRLSQPLSLECSDGSRNGSPDCYDGRTSGYEYRGDVVCVKAFLM